MWTLTVVYPNEVVLILLILSWLIVSKYSDCLILKSFHNYMKEVQHVRIGYAYSFI